MVRGVAAPQRLNRAHLPVLLAGPPRKTGGAKQVSGRAASHGEQTDRRVEAEECFALFV